MIVTSLLYTVFGVADAAGSAVISTITAHHTELTGGAGHGVVIADVGFEQAFLVLLVGGVVGIVVTLLMRHGRKPATGGADADQEQVLRAGAAASRQAGRQATVV
ncbi:hypothetical protein [Streptomyces sp. NPDC055681]